MTSILDPAQRAAFDRDGYVIVPGLFDAEETAILNAALTEDPAIQEHFCDRDDADGLKTKIALWNHPGDSVYGLAARTRKMVDTMEDVLGGEVYHYHSKLTAKDPREGGAWEWHQDYGYWYNNGCLYPYMASAMVALDKCTRSNGCLQVLKGSHHLGRIDHGVLDGGQVGADADRVVEATKHLEVVYAEMDPGDTLFFHCNTLHRSDQNRSGDRRWTLICCYNAARNDPYVPHEHPRYTPLHKVADDAVKQAGVRFAAATDADMFMQVAETPPQLAARRAELYRR